MFGVLAQGDAITDPEAILRYALPIENKPVRQLQAAIEDIAKHLRAKRWPPIQKDVREANYALNVNGAKILEGIPATLRPQGETLLNQLKEQMTQLDAATQAKDRETITDLRGDLLAKITHLEELMVAGFPFAVPEEYANLPQLQGRATVEIETTKGKMTMIIDGYSAPVNGGNFVDLVERGFYDGLPFIRSEDNFVLQTGDPEGAAEGFIDPKTKEYRAIPLEILISGEDKPIYGTTLEDAGVYLPKLALPFNSFGAVALARPDTEPNGGSSQFFFFKFDNELTPPGFNLMDGRYSVFGYVVSGKEVLEELTEQDKIISARVTAGAENLVKP
jgi:peptidylprolyl isomerase